MARWVERFLDRLAQSPELASFAGDLMEVDVAPTRELIDCGAWMMHSIIDVDDREAVDSQS